MKKKVTRREEREKIIYKHVNGISNGRGCVIWLVRGLLSKREDLTEFRNLSVLSKPGTVAHVQSQCYRDLTK